MDNINITFPNGSTKQFEKGISAYNIAESISPRLAEEALAVKVNGNIKDIHSKVEQDAAIQFLTFKDEEGKEVYWHSTSHLMAHAIQEIYPEAKFGVGPAIENGFYYDIDINSSITEEDLLKIENKIGRASCRERV